MDARRILLVALAAALSPALCPAQQKRGPLMTDEQFFAALNLNLPALSAVRQAVQRGDFAQAKRLFAQYMRSRKTPRYFFTWDDKPPPEKRPKNPDTRIADDALRHRFTVTGVPYQFGEEIDWTANPTDPFDPEWTWQFSRHSWWSHLGRAYWETGDEKYAREWVSELRSWIRKNPMPAQRANRVGSRWRTIECGIRLAYSWPAAFNYFLRSPAFTDDDLILMLKSLAEQAEYLYQNPTRGNWLTMEANGMGHVGILFPEFRRAKVWRETAIARLYRELEGQVYPDGVQIELTTGYHYVALRNFLGLAQLAQLNDVPLPEDYVAKLERMYAAGLWVMKPSRRVPAVNDAWPSDVRASLREGYQLFPQRKDFLWVASDGKQGTPPDHTSHFFPWAGWAVMRSGWERDALYLFFDVGPFGYSHQHEDKLAVIVSAYGADLVVDTGSYRYDTSAMRRYVLGPWAHNIVFVDGQGQHRRGLRETYVNKRPQSNPWITTPALDYCEGAYQSGFGPDRALRVRHVRKVLFVKPEYWVILDTLAPEDGAEHSYSAHFHFGVDEAQVSFGGRGVSTANAGGANLHILALGEGPVAADVVKGQEKPQMLGWRGKHGVGGKRPIPVARFRWRARGLSRALFVLYPTRPGEKLPIAAVERAQPTAGQGFGAQIRFADGRADAVLFNARPGERVGLGKAQTPGFALVIRRGAEGSTRVLEARTENARG